MGSILIDNTSLGRVVESYLGENKINYYKNDDIAIQNYLYALVLWDEIYSYKPSHFSLDEVENKKIYKYMGYNYNSYRYDRRENDYLKIKNIEVSEGSQIEYNTNYISHKYLKEYNNEYNKIVKDSIFYILLGYNLGLNVYLSKERTKFIKNLGVFEDVFNREDVISIVEKDVLEFYREINEKIGKELISFHSPLFLDYISQNCDNLKEAIQLAKYIREEKDVVQFRKAMDEMEVALNSGNFVLFNEYLSIIPDIVSSIKKSGIKTSSTTITISTVPSIAFPMEIESRKRKKKMLHIDFLTDLAMYGMYNRLLR